MTDSELTLKTAGKALVFGGTYGNFQATQRLFEVAEGLGIGPDSMFCSGDTVAYCAQPQECVDLLRESGVFTIMGNCEESLGSDADDCGCGFGEGTLCDLLSRQWYDFCRQRLSPESKAWMAQLPRQAVIEIGGRRLLMVHGAPSSNSQGISHNDPRSETEAISRFIFPSTPWATKKALVDESRVDGVLGGHSGLPFAQLTEDRLWLNSGALGMPANDGTPRGWYAVLAEAPQGLAVGLHGLAYDHDKAASEMAAQDLKTGYADCLLNGLWPSLDVLPKEERAVTGQALLDTHLLWPAHAAPRASAAAAS